MAPSRISNDHRRRGRFRSPASSTGRPRRGDSRSGRRPSGTRDHHRSFAIHPIDCRSRSQSRARGYRSRARSAQRYSSVTFRVRGLNEHHACMMKLRCSGERGNRGDTTEDREGPTRCWAHISSMSRGWGMSWSAHDSESSPRRLRRWATSHRGTASPPRVAQPARTTCRGVPLGQDPGRRHPCRLAGCVLGSNFIRPRAS